MKRHQMPATTLSAMKKVAFTIFCCTLLTLFAAPVWAQGQCSGALIPGEPPKLGTATGCGALINVTAVDPDTGKATAFTVTSLGNGNPYDATNTFPGEDTLIGIQNSSNGTLISITLSSPVRIFGFDADGPCQFGGTQDCFGGSFGYEGPNNNFSNISNDHTSGTINFVTPCGSECTTPGIGPGVGTWFALEGTPDSFAGESQTLTFACPSGNYPCNNVQQQATDNCGLTNPVTGACTNHDASSIKIGFDTVMQRFQLQVTFTEVDGDGVCVIPTSGNANDSTDFDCTWANFFGDSKPPSYGSGPPFTSTSFLFTPGMVVHVPYCLHYARNNKCMDIDAELLNGAAQGTHFFSGSLALYAAWNASPTSSLFPLPLGGPWGNDPTVSPRFYDAPHDDSDTADYPFPIPTGYPYSPSDQQKVFDITGYYNPLGQAGVDGGIGCHHPPTCSKTTNHYAVAFPLAASTPDEAQLLFPFAKPDPACYVAGRPMSVVFELETTGTEIDDVTALTAPNYARITVLQGTVPVNAPLLVPVTLFNPPPPFGFLTSYFAALSNANLNTNTVYQLQIQSNLLGKPLTKNFIVKKRCS